jgi:antitoxin component of RelBE/YafQ-DinJ toxin-antitoxin module
MFLLLTNNIRLYILLDMDTTMLVKTKKDLKTKAQALAKDLGLSLTDVVNASLRQFLVNQGITISKLPTETLDAYTNKKEIILGYRESLKEF